MIFKNLSNRLGLSKSLAQGNLGPSGYQYLNNARKLVVKKFPLKQGPSGEIPNFLRFN